MIFTQKKHNYWLKITVLELLKKEIETQSASHLVHVYQPCNETEKEGPGNEGAADIPLNYSNEVIPGGPFYLLNLCSFGHWSAICTYMM